MFYYMGLWQLVVGPILTRHQHGFGEFSRQLRTFGVVSCSRQLVRHCESDHMSETCEFILRGEEKSRHQQIYIIYLWIALDLRAPLVDFHEAKPIVQFRTNGPGQKQ